MSDAASTPLRIGLLVVDSIQEPHRGIAGDYPELFERLLSPFGVDLVAYDGRARTLPSIDECDGWIVPGSRDSVYDGLDWIPPLSAWVRHAVDAEAPLVGVCFGHQLVAAALGAHVERNPAGWGVGAVAYDATAAPPGTVDVPRSFRILACHQDRVVDLPAGATLVASTDDCPIAAFSVGPNVFCVQGHPEFVADQAASIYASRLELLGRATHDEAMASLDQPLDSDLVGQWIATALRSAAASSGRTPRT